MKKDRRSPQNLPRLLVIDDLFGRNVLGGGNPDRENLCAHFLWQDVTGDIAARLSRQKVLEPTAQVVFCRGQTPIEAKVGNVVENDLEGTLAAVQRGWPVAKGKRQTAAYHLWSMVLVDLCFYTGRVTEESHRQTPGMPEGRPGDDDWRSYFGLTLLEAIHRDFPDLPILVLSGKSRDEVSLEFSQRGAVGFIARDDLRGPELLQDALQLHGLLPDPAGEIIGQSLPLLLALRDARRAAMHRENVLIRGERGAGKELIARYLHRNASSEGSSCGASTTPFITVNSAVFTQNLFASEFFGIEPRTATGVEGKIGLIEAAQGGDLFLDEVADMPDEVQAAILRVLQEHQFTRVGGKQPLHANVRFISATNAAIEEPEYGFRADVLDRLRLGGTITLPPLRERLDDLSLLVESLVQEAERQNRRARHHQVSPEVLKYLCTHDWPGNIRELRSLIFDAINRFPDVEHLVSGHLKLPKKSSEVTPLADVGGQLAEVRTRDVPTNNESVKADSLNALLSMIERFDFRSDAINEWAGRLVEVQRASTWLLARYLEACLDATKRRTPEAPRGQVQVHPAVKLLTGNAGITASQAADLIKRLLGPLESDLNGCLRDAYETAVRLRPKSVSLLVRKGSDSS
jgi:DNA-binding NtrC family response regulator